MTRLGRQEIIDNAEWLSELDVFQNEKQYLLTDYVESLDVEIIEILLKSGAEPDINMEAQYTESNYGFLHDLIHKYYILHDTKGELILQCAELLLKFGANPNQAGDSNLAPIQKLNSGDYTKSFVNLLLTYGANPSGNQIY